jgi:hypothetical protein
MHPTCHFTLALTICAHAGELAFSDPANVQPPPPGAVGQAVRTPDFDVRPGFVNPPPGFGEVGFFWWLGDKLTRERLTWQLDQLSGKGVSGLQINYAHDDHGGRSYGLTFPSDPPLFSEDWWSLSQWFVQAAKQRGMAVSLSDYTLGTAGQGSYVDELLARNPDLRGATLSHQSRIVQGGTKLALERPANAVSQVAFQRAEGKLVPGSGMDLAKLGDAKQPWDAPPGEWEILTVLANRQELSIDPMHPEIGKKAIEVFFQRFEDRNPGEAGKGLNFFFSDELQFGVGGKLWNGNLAAEFSKRKGYDLLPELAALFVDLGPRTPKIRLDYSDVMVALQEEGYFKPVFDWHQQRGMIYGCDHGGRGRQVDEFGDYFRTQRWNQGPGADQPGLGKNLIKAKVAASIAHLYDRPRVWLEGFYGSGWHTSSADVADATFANFAMGFNLLTLHGLYYSTKGGWWEWAPPCNHFHMPYWRHMGTFLECTQRLSYLLTQGRHRCDVAVMYPVAPKEAGMNGDAAVTAAFATGETLYQHGLDFDFMDFESLARATVKGRELHVGQAVYRALVLPAMQAARFSTVQKAVEFQRAGGLVIVLGAPPEASDRAGREDPELTALVAGLPTRVTTPAEVSDLIGKSFTRDFTGPGNIHHRRIGPRDVFLIYGGAKDTECTFRATGKTELWDPWTGTSRELPVMAQTAETTTLKLPLTAKEVQLIVFSPGTPATTAPAAPTPLVAPVTGDWDFELQPVLDNRFGDYHWPATPGCIGAEVRQLEFSETGTPAGPWRKVTCGFGPKFWKLGPLPDDFDESALVGLQSVNPSVPVISNGKPYRWQPYELSWRWGKEGDPGHQGYHGLKGRVTDEFLCLGAPRGGKNETLYGAEPGGNRYYLWSSVPADQAITAYPHWGGLVPAAAWLNHQPLGKSAALRVGSNPLLIRYDQAGRGYFVMTNSAAAIPSFAPPAPAGKPVFVDHPLAMRWWNAPAVLPFDPQPELAKPVGWFRFTAPPGMRGMTIAAPGSVTVAVAGVPARDEGNGRFTVTTPSPTPAPVLIRVEPPRGSHAGAALPEYLRLDCGPGVMPPGDWAAVEGLQSYSGGAWYRKTITLPAARTITLDLGNVNSSAEVRVNGQPAGIRVAPPWTFDLSRNAKPGANRIEVLVYNTLSNHYRSIPTHYNRPVPSGLLGPVTVSISE